MSDTLEDAQKSAVCVHKDRGQYEVWDGNGSVISAYYSFSILTHMIIEAKNEEITKAE